MRYIEWAVMFVVAGLGIGLANFVGFDVNFMDSLPGILILLAISLVAVVISKLVPLKLPIIAYCSILGSFSGLSDFSDERGGHRSGQQD